MNTFKGYYALQPHQGKEAAFVEALRVAGYRQSGYARAVRFALYNLDSGHGGYGWSKSVEEYAERGVPLFLFPHAARPMVQYDGLIEVNPHVKCLFTFTDCGKRVLESFGFPRPIEVVGWSFCPIQPFQSPGKVENVVFGAIHPNKNGWLSDLDMNLNQKTFQRIHAWCKKSKAKLTVRHLHSLEACGLTRAAGVTYNRGSADNSTLDIDRADLVIGHQTFAYLAVARGKPTLMMGEYIPPRSGNKPENYRYVKHWDLYKDLLMFPLDIMGDEPTDKLIERAVRSDEDIHEWKENFIGKTFDGPAFVKKLERYL